MDNLCVRDLYLMHIPSTFVSSGYWLLSMQNTHKKYVLLGHIIQLTTSSALWMCLGNDQQLVHTEYLCIHIVSYFASKNLYYSVTIMVSNLNVFDFLLKFSTYWALQSSENIKLWNKRKMIIAVNIALWSEVVELLRCNIG